MRLDKLGELNPEEVNGSDIILAVNHKLLNPAICGVIETNANRIGPGVFAYNQRITGVVFLNRLTYLPCSAFIGGGLISKVRSVKFERNTEAEIDAQENLRHWNDELGLERVTADALKNEVKNIEYFEPELTEEYLDNLEREVSVSEATSRDRLFKLSKQKHRGAAYFLALKCKDERLMREAASPDSPMRFPLASLHLAKQAVSAIKKGVDALLSDASPPGGLYESGYSGESEAAMTAVREAANTIRLAGERKGRNLPDYGCDPVTEAELILKSFWISAEVR